MPRFATRRKPGRETGEPAKPRRELASGEIHSEKEIGDQSRRSGVASRKDGEAAPDVRR